MRARIFTYLTIASFISTSAWADPATLTANANFRSGPGTGFESFGVLREGSAVDIKECDEGAAWCAVTHGEKNGFVSGRYLVQTEPAAPSWPRTFTNDAGASLTMYQPQVTDWPNFSQLEALIAAELKTSADAKPVYGVIGVSAKSIADDEADEVTLSELKVTRVEFSTLSKERLAKVALEVGKIVPTDPIVVSEERLTASLADFKRLDNVNGMKAEPPPIFISKVPAVLVQTDGKAVLSQVRGVAGLSFVVNTNWDLFKVDADGAYYLRSDKTWLKSQSLESGWTKADSVPDLLSRLPDDEMWKDVKGSLPVAASKDAAPEVFYSEKPAELIVFDGEPVLEPVKGTGLEWVANAGGAVFHHKASATWYVLVSGRWFSSASLDGPWAFATPTLPEDFLNIPDDAPYYAVRASIPGTSESAEARLKASIPKMAKVAIDGSVKVEVTYSGEPKFEPITGTSMSYAVNSNEQVIKVADKYYVLKDGVWFVGDTPTGPFAVARAVADEIYTIPASSPVYNVTYVRAYDTEPDGVWYGYTAGYLGAYLAWDALVWGTGWYYPSYWDYGHSDGYRPYYPRPISYGVGAFYNPAFGTYGRYGYAYGPNRGIAGGAAYNPRTGTYFRGGVATGPNGTRGFVAAYNPRTGNALAARGGQNVYGSWGKSVVKHGGEFARISGGSTGNAGGLHWKNTQGHSGFIAGGKGGDVYAGRDGNVYRRNDGQWQKHGPDGWNPVERPNADSLKAAGKRAAGQNPQAAERARNRVENRQTPRRDQQARKPRQRAPDHLSLDRAGREFGNRGELSQRYGRSFPEAGGNFQGFDHRGGYGGGGGFHGGGFQGGGGFHGGGHHGGAAFRGGGGRGGGGRGGGRGR